MPLSARVSPASTEISVVLPAPFGPSRPKNSPSSTSRLTPASACTRPKRRATLTTSTARDTFSRMGRTSGHAAPARDAARDERAGLRARRRSYRLRAEDRLDAIHRRPARRARRAHERSAAACPRSPRAACSASSTATADESMASRSVEIDLARRSAAAIADVAPSTGPALANVSAARCRSSARRHRVRRRSPRAISHAARRAAASLISRRRPCCGRRAS